MRHALYGHKHGQRRSKPVEQRSSEWQCGQQCVK
jgi:hypothetical protein